MIVAMLYIHYHPLALAIRMDKTGRGAGVGVGDGGIKSGDWELGDHNASSTLYCTT